MGPFREGALCALGPVREFYPMYDTYGTCAHIHARTRFRRSQTISTVCVGYAIFRPSGCVGTPAD